MKKGKGKNSGLLPNSLRIISSCLKTVSTNASTVASTVRNASASVAASVSSGSEDLKDQVTWAGFDRLELGPSVFKHVLLLGYQNGFQVLDVEDASNFSELASKRDGPVTFLQMQPFPEKADGDKGFSASYPLLLVVAGEDTNGLNVGQTPSKLGGVGRDGNMDSQSGNPTNSSMTVQFYSLRSHSYVHVLRFRSAVRMVRCSPHIVAVGLATQIYCFDALTLESKFSVLTYPIPQLSGQGNVGVNVGYGPMAVGTRWLAYASSNPLMSSTGRLSPQNLTPSPGVSPSTSPGSSSLMARYAMESSKHLAAGIINLGDMGYKTLSKYCQELLPDGSNSPVSPSSSWKAGRLAGAEMDNAGMVVVKDFVSRSVIAQFKAHTSPISALCFDPSGTLLVTASVYGNNINIFRIMPSCTRSGSGSQNYEWSSSHVHLYKLHRGITSATIQDICFSHYSQWISIVSSKGTCHIFVLSPFGGDVGFQTHNSKGEEPSLFPVSSSPWWSTSSFVTSQKLPIPPPTPVVLSVVSRVKYNDSGWLNTVSNAAASAAGKVFVPSGAIAAVFHSSVSVNAQQVNSKANSLEHLLVYTPSGHVIQHKLLPSVGTEQSDSGSRTRPGSFLQIQEEDLRVKVEPVQWWDVCRRSDWPERAECVFQTTFKKQDAAEVTLDKLGSKDCYGVDALDLNKSFEGKKFVKTDLSKPHERSHWYLSNAEVQISSGRLPIWHKSKISFYTMDSPKGEGCKGELEVEKVSTNEVEMRWKELLPVFDNFHHIKSGWGDSDHDGEKYPLSSLEPHQAKHKITDESVICHSKPSSLGSTESSEGGSSRRMDSFPDLDQMNMEKAYIPTCQSLNGSYQERPESAIVVPTIDVPKLSSYPPIPCEYLTKAESRVDESNLSSYPPIPSEYLSKAESCVDESNLPVAEGASLMDARGLNEVTTSNADPFDSKVSVFLNGVMQSTVNQEVDFGQFLQEGHCKALESDGTHGSLTQVIADDVDSGEKDKHEDDEENDDMLGGMFAFSEEG